MPKISIVLLLVLVFIVLACLSAPLPPIQGNNNGLGPARAPKSADGSSGGDRTKTTKTMPMPDHGMVPHSGGKRPTTTAPPTKGEIAPLQPPGESSWDLFMFRLRRQGHAMQQDIGRSPRTHLVAVAAAFATLAIVIYACLWRPLVTATGGGSPVVASLVFILSAIGIAGWLLS